MERYVLKIKDWKTPATEYPLRRVGTAEITRENYKRGFYWMEGVDGYIFFKVLKPIPVTNLEIDGEIWMVDDPLHWIGMQRLAEHSEGRVLVGGLGLGLVIHALDKNPKVKEVDVAEINKDVIDLIKPLIPMRKVKIHNRNVLEMASDRYDTVILDLWVYSENSGIDRGQMYTEMIETWAFFKATNPESKVYVWGTGDSGMNPAVNGNVRKIIEELRR